MVPLNLHHSLALRTIARNSRNLQNISRSVYALTESLVSIEQSAASIAGSTSAILELLESKEHREGTIAGMRSLIFSHQQTCNSASRESDLVTAMASCIVSERLLNQPWFNMQLFSHVSFEEMNTATQMMSKCEDTMSEIESRMDDDELTITQTLSASMDQLEALELERKGLVKNFELSFEIPKTMWKHHGSLNTPTPSTGGPIYDPDPDMGLGDCLIALHWFVNRPKGALKEYTIFEIDPTIVADDKAGLLDDEFKQKRVQHNWNYSLNYLKKVEPDIHVELDEAGYDATREIHGAFDDWRRRAPEIENEIESIMKNANDVFNGRLNIEHFLVT